MRARIVPAEVEPSNSQRGMPSDKYFQEYGVASPTSQTPVYQDDTYIDPAMGSQHPMAYPQQQSDDYFNRPSDLRVIQEYNREEMLPEDVRTNFWGMLSKSIKLGFWDKEDEQELFFHKNLIKVGYIMSKPKHRYTFADRQKMNMVDLLFYADFKRGVGMEKYRLNERTLQATSVTQNIQGGNTGGKKGGVLAGLKAFFG